MKKHLNQLLEKHNLGTLSRFSLVTGGCINQCFHIVTQKNIELFVKTNTAIPNDFFLCEAVNLKSLQESASLRIPHVIAHSEHCLILDYIEAGEPEKKYWLTLAHGLAALHKKTQPQFGFYCDNYCGSTPQPNPICADGLEFFSHYRLRYQMELASRHGRLNTNDSKQLERLINRLSELLPNEPASLIHGDLWSGNIYCDSAINPVLVDPACYWGFREADIAMSRLFGQLPNTFYNTYQEIHPMEPGWEQRMDIYNLYHLLNHLNLFGQSYLGQIKQIISVFS